MDVREWATRRAGGAGLNVGILNTDVKATDAEARPSARLTDTQYNGDVGRLGAPALEEIVLNHSSSARTRRAPATLLLLGGLALGVAGCGSPAPPEPAPASTPTAVLLITLDTTRADHLGSHGGSAVTPRLDRLAAEGTRFSQATAQAPVTLPTHASMLTGLYPPTHGVRYNGTYVLPESVDTLAELLLEEGFRTAALVSAFPVSSRFGIGQGFERFDDSFLDGADPSSVREAERPGERTVDRAVELLGGLRDDRFFVWVHLFDAHWPYEPPEDRARLHPGSPYAAEISAVDGQVGRLLDALESIGRSDDTVVLVVGDHGESLGEHGEQFHSLLMYEGVSHIPFIVRTPGGVAGQVSDAAIGGLDVFPTVLELLGLPVPANQGRSLAAALHGGELPDSSGVYFEAMSGYLNYGWGQVRGLRRGRYKYSSAPVPELYDVLADRAEEHNLIDSEPELASELAAALDALIVELDSGSGEHGGDVLDEDTRARLLALGYVVAGYEPDAAAEDSVVGANPADMVFLERPLVTASQLFASEAYGELMPLLERVLAVDPRNRMSLFYLGFAEWATGRRPQALETLGELVDLYPDYPPAYRELGRLLLESGESGRAIELLGRADDRFPDMSEFPFYLALALSEAGRTDDALPVLERALETFPGLGKFHLLAARCLALAGRLDEAREALVAATETGMSVAPMLDREPAFAPFRDDRALRRSPSAAGS